MNADDERTGRPYVWLPKAAEFAAEYGISRADVEAAADQPTSIKTDPSTVTVGYPVLERRRGDIAAVVGYREDPAAIMYVRLFLPGEGQSNGGGSRAPGGTGATGPRSLLELRKRIVADGFRIAQDSKHAQVLSRDGDFICSLPGTPSDHRTLANVWSTYRRSRDRFYARRRTEAGDLLSAWSPERWRDGR